MFYINLLCLYCHTFTKVFAEYLYNYLLVVAEYKAVTRGSGMGLAALGPGWHATLLRAGGRVGREQGGLQWARHTNTIPVGQTLLHGLHFWVTGQHNSDVDLAMRAICCVIKYTTHPNTVD